jgi:DNA polymerase I-like protein with 3'-5' exonuclease and polymerase domains
MKKTLPREAKKDEWVAIDIEMYGQDRARLHRPHGTFACISISYSPRETYVVEAVQDMRSALRRIRHGTWVLQNASYDIRQLRRFVDIPQRPIWDTMLVEQGLFSGWYEDFGLEHLARRWLNRVLSKDERSNFGKRSTLTEEMRRYAARDAYVTLQVARAQKAYVDEENLSMKHYWDVDERAMWAVLDMPPSRIDVDGWLKLAGMHEKIGMKMQDEIGFNVLSHEIVKKKIKEETGEKLKNTKGKDTLEPLERKLRGQGRTGEADFLRHILDTRMYRKAASTYGQKFIDDHVEDGGLVYGDFRVIGTRSGRMSCTNPNLQNIPVRNLPIFRKLFVSQFPRGRMYVADAWQQEVCILAYFSEDRMLKEDLLKGKDLHQQAADDFGLSRRQGKDINLGLGYGMSEWGLASRTGMSMADARRGISKRQRRYGGVSAWNDKQKARAIALEYVETTMGRRVWINQYDRQWERHSINLPIQGTAAEHTKLWLILTHEYCRSQGIPFRVPLVIHDELVADVPPGEGKAWRSILTRTGVDGGAIAVPSFPMRTEIVSGRSWGAKE